MLAVVSDNSWDDLKFTCIVDNPGSSVQKTVWNFIPHWLKETLLWKNLTIMKRLDLFKIKSWPITTISYGLLKILITKNILCFKYLSCNKVLVYLILWQYKMLIYTESQVRMNSYQNWPQSIGVGQPSQTLPAFYNIAKMTISEHY